MEEDFAENVCQLVDVLRILRKRAGSGVRIRYLTRVRTGPRFRVGLANVPHLQKPAHIRCRDELFAKLVQPFHLDLSPVPLGFSVTKPLTNAANTDM